MSAEHVTDAIRQRVVDLRGLETEATARAIDSHEGTKIYVTDAVAMNISATAIRELAGAGRSDEVARLVPPPVADFMEKYRLYQTA